MDAHEAGGIQPSLEGGHRFTVEVGPRADVELDLTYENWSSVSRRTVKVDAVMADTTVIYTGQTKVMVAAGETREVALALAPAPGRLAITMDVQPLLDAGKVFDKGSLYLYYGDSSITPKDMTLAGGSLAAQVELAPRTYDAKVAVPNVTNSIFTSEYFSFDILPGRTTTVSLGADGALSVDISIAAEPDRVTNLRAMPNGATVTLTWDQAARATGYRIYRTDKDGRYKDLGAVEGGSVTTYTDENFGTAAPYDGKVRYAVAAVAGTVEGLRSEPAEVTVG